MTENDAVTPIENEQWIREMTEKIEQNEDPDLFVYWAMQSAWKYGARPWDQLYPLIYEKLEDKEIIRQLAEDKHCPSRAWACQCLGDRRGLIELAAHSGYSVSNITAFESLGEEELFEVASRSHHTHPEHEWAVKRIEDVRLLVALIPSKPAALKLASQAAAGNEAAVDALLRQLEHERQYKDAHRAIDFNNAIFTALRDAYVAAEDEKKEAIRCRCPKLKGHDDWVDDDYWPSHKDLHYDYSLDTPNNHGYRW